MAIDWSHLPREVINSVCMNATSRCGKGFVLDPDGSGYQICAGCRRPTVQVAVQECDICDKVFVPKFYQKILYAWAGICCDDCEPPT